MGQAQVGEVTDRGARLRGYARQGDWRVCWLLHDSLYDRKPKLRDFHIFRNLETQLLNNIWGVLQ